MELVSQIDFQRSTILFLESSFVGLFVFRYGNRDQAPQPNISLDTNDQLKSAGDIGVEPPKTTNMEPPDGG